MNYLGDNAGLGLTSEQTEKVLQLQDLTGIEDMTICRDVLQRHQWNLEVAVQEQLNIREGRPSIYATESRPPAVINDLLGQHIYYSMPRDGGGGGVLGFAKALFNFFYNICYSTILALFQIGRRMIRYEPERPTDPLDDVLGFIRLYQEKYTDNHPVFYQGTFSQALNDAKRELRFLLVYLHKEDHNDAELFCRETLSHPEIIQYINARFIFWACSQTTHEGRRAQSTIKAGSAPFLGVLVLRDNSMTVVGRMEGYCDPTLLLQRLNTVVSDFEISLVQTRADRYEASLNRSLRAHQDEAFLESLRADQEKERRKEEERLAREAELRREEEEARAEEERRQSIAREKIESVDKVPDEPDSQHPDAVHVVFKLPCGSRIERRFLKTHSLEAVFYFVFCHPNSPDSFEITTNFPKRVLKCKPEIPYERVLTLEEAGLKNREVLFVNDLDA
ncbi:hypothetical protein Zmor_023960 [Zophobas morio]|uniref:UBX domain-containing protein n=1 Tax=Zophobas morio TaxID=2755281 RepID=A0AA38M6X5_9CUCU|nr:hypothetical protein Zmor_023960 [Zophobas morio]